MNAAKQAKFHFSTKKKDTSEMEKDEILDFYGRESFLCFIWGEILNSSLPSKFQYNFPAYFRIHLQILTCLSQHDKGFSVKQKSAMAFFGNLEILEFQHDICTF